MISKLFEMHITYVCLLEIGLKQLNKISKPLLIQPRLDWIVVRQAWAGTAGAQLQRANGPQKENPNDFHQEACVGAAKQLCASDCPPADTRRAIISWRIAFTKLGESSEGKNLGGIAANPSRLIANVMLWMLWGHVSITAVANAVAEKMETLAIWRADTTASLGQPWRYQPRTCLTTLPFSCCPPCLDWLDVHCSLRLAAHWSHRVLLWRAVRVWAPRRPE